MILAVKPSFIAGENIESSRVIGEDVEGFSGAFGWIQVVMVFELVLDGGLFEGPEAEQTPSGDGEIFHQLGIGFGLRIHLIEQVIEELVEEGLIFTIEDDAAGEKTVAKAVGRRDSLAFGRFRTVGLGAVGAAGL